jgi:hypothetical protein
MQLGPHIVSVGAYRSQKLLRSLSTKIGVAKVHVATKTQEQKIASINPKSSELALSPTLAIKINIILYNIQGINYLIALQCISNYHSPLIPNLDILCIHEYKLQVPRVEDLGSHI